jgi:2-polyprenyl-3-methyl-5-hydroxy-6-metoxy-1,4-benzoquinol methylase
VICDQVLEHVVDPIMAMRTVLGSCHPGGLAGITTPFLYFVHEAPGDY